MTNMKVTLTFDYMTVAITFYKTNVRPLLSIKTCTYPPKFALIQTYNLPLPVSFWVINYLLRVCET